MGFAAGFSVGYESGKDFKERRKKAKMEKDLTAVGADADAVRGKGLRVGGDEGVVTGQGVDEYGNAISAEDAYRQAYSRAGMEAPTIESTGDRYAVRSGEGRDIGSVYTDANQAESGARKANYGLARERANVYERYGEGEMARGLRKDAQNMRLQDAKEDRGVAAHEQNMEMGGLQLKGAQRSERMAQQMEMFEADAAQLEAQGALQSIDDWKALAAQHGLGPNEMFKVATTKMGLDELQTKADTIQRTKLFDQAARQGLGAVIQLYDNHPLFDNGMKMTARQGRNGIELYDGDVLVTSAANERDALALLRTHLEDPVKATMLAYDIEKTRADIDKSRATADSERAQSNYSRAAAGQLAKPDYSLTMIDDQGAQWAYDKRDPNKRVKLGIPGGKPMDDETRLEILTMAGERAASVPGFAKLPPDAQQKLVDQEAARLMQNMRPPRGGAQQPGDWQGAMDAKLGGGQAPKAQGMPTQRPITGIDRITMSNERLAQIKQLKGVLDQLPPDNPQRNAVVERIKQLGMEYSSIMNSR